MSQPLVSVIIPVFNAVETVERALLSVINQGCASKEMIVVDGLSQDGSLDIIKRYIGDIAHFISEKDSGIYAGINKGINLAKGEWIYIMGADDELAESDVLEKIISATLSHTKLFYGSVQNKNVKHKLVPQFHHSKFESTLYWRNSLHQQSAFYHRSLFSHFRFDERLKILADYDFHLKLFNEKIQAQPLSLVVARCEASGVSKNFRWSLYREELQIKKRRLPTLIYALNLPWVVLKFLGKRWG
ncbi:MAG: glycosyltransferase family 2 protein [Flavobacteriales bacterium]|nr:glycosyltransferase family 2 protein [Flavobacteriales bacterium]